MISKQDIIDVITNNVYTNGRGLITGAVLQQVLLTMVDFTEDALSIFGHWQEDAEGNIFTTKNAYSLGQISAFGLAEEGEGGEPTTPGTTVAWGTETETSIELTVEGVKKTLSLSSHTHDVYSITGLVSALNNKQDKLTAGTGITISGNTISATGGGGSSVSWGTTSNNYSPLTVEGISKTVALSGHTHSFTEITGTATTTQIPNLPTSKITSGTFDIARIPTGTTSSTVALGNDSRIVNGQTAYGWGNHASAGYALNSSLANYVPTSRTVTAGNGLTGGGALSSNITLTLATPSSITLSSTNSVAASSHTHSLALGGTSSQYLNGATSLVTIPTITAGDGMSGGGQLTMNRTLTLGTPSALTTSTTNSVTASSHTHSITTTSVGAVNTIVQTDSTGAVRGNSLKVGADWSFELSGTELQIKRGGAITHRLLADGSIVGLGEVTAYGAGTGGDGVALLKTGGTMTGTLILDTDADLGASNKALNLLGNSFKYNNSNILTEANTASKITMGNGWTIEQTIASLTIRRNGVVKGTFNA